ISTQADGAQSSRVPVPLLEDHYEAIRQAYLVEADTESEPFEDLVETETHDSAFPTNYQLLKHRFLPEWSSSSLPVSPTPSIVPLLISSPMVPLTVPSPVASPAMAETEGFLTELGGRVEMQGGLICGQTDAQREALWHAINDTQIENRELRLQIVEERRTRMGLAEIVNSMRRGQEPRGDV
ncbi:hypothetical protein Tco_0703989, partial [Tanacetum coccineum]